ncbi:telomere-associated protein Tap [Streptomyces apocyni]|uniref:telomere-associated protein Tap n=1 Tax=Streptomyces apocyni TaxID=2654677 RepID=UPI0012EA9CF6|nr:transcriptional regulator [Streptomyces apocyni]
MNEHFVAVDALIGRGPHPPQLPTPEERRHLREAWGASLEEFASTLNQDTDDMEAWEAGHRGADQADEIAYLRLLNRIRQELPPGHEPDWAALRRRPAPSPHPPRPVPPCDSCGQPMGRCEHCGQPTTHNPGGRWLHQNTNCAPQGPRIPQQPAAPQLPLRLPKPPGGFPLGPLAVIDHHIDNDRLVAHLRQHRSMECPARTLPDLLAWAYTRGIGAPRLHAKGNHVPPLLILTAAATGFFGLPLALDDPVERLLPADHPVLADLGRAGWPPTQPGMGPWSRLQTRVSEGHQVTVRLAVQPWGAVGDSWGLHALEAKDLATVTTRYADTVLTPYDTPAACGSDLMTELRPPKQWATQARSGRRVLEPAARGALTAAYDPAPPEAPADHPVAGRDRNPDDVLREEAYNWYRQPARWERETYRHVVALAVNFAFTNAAGKLKIGYGPPGPLEHQPTFDPSVPGTWYADLSGIPTDSRLPSPFTASGQPPTGPTWYTTPTLAYAQQLASQAGLTIKPIKAYLRHGNAGTYLEPWNKRLREAYWQVLRRLRIAPDATGSVFLHACEQAEVEGDQLDWILLSAIKATADGGIDRLHEDPIDRDREPHERWPALNRVTWRPDIRAAIIATARTELHRKMTSMANAGRYPVAVLSDRIVYPTTRPTPLDILPDERPVPGSFTLSPRFGHVTLEGTHTMDWAHTLLARHINPAAGIKDPDAHLPLPREKPSHPAGPDEPALLF